MSLQNPDHQHNKRKFDRIQSVHVKEILFLYKDTEFGDSSSDSEYEPENITDIISNKNFSKVSKFRSILKLFNIFKLENGIFHKKK